MLRQVVRREDRHLAGVCQLRPHHGDVHPADRQNTRTAPRRRADCSVLRQRPVDRHHRMVGDERRQMCTNADRPHARPTTAMGNAKGFVQIHVRHVGADVRRSCQPDLRIEVGAVHVHLTAVLVDNLANLADALLVHTVGRWIGRHQARQLIPSLGGFCLQILQINVTRLVALDDHHAHPGHLCRGWIGAVGRRRNQADIPCPLLAALVIFADRQQPGVLALSAGVGLHANRIEPGNRAQPALKLFDHQGVADRLLPGHEGMQIGELRPGDRDHFAGGVEFHGAGAQRDHRLVERQILGLQLLEITQHLGFAVMGVEHRMTQIRCAALKIVWNAGNQRLSVKIVDDQSMIGAKQHIKQLCHCVLVTRFVEAQTDPATAENPQVDLRSLGTFDNRGLRAADVQCQRVEKLCVDPVDTVALKTCRQNAGQPMHPLRDALQAFRPVIDRVETGDVGQQHLRRADVRIGFLAADMLLAGLQGHTQRDVAAGVFRHTDDPPGNRPFVFLATGEKSGVWPAIAHRHAKALRRTEHHIGAQLTRRRQQQQTEQISGDTGQRLLGMQVIDERPQIADLAVGVGVFQQCSKYVVLLQVIHSADDQLETETFGPGLHDGNGLWMTVLVDKKQIALRLGDTFGQCHGFRRRSSLIEQ